MQNIKDICRIVISDVHLGSIHSNELDLLEFLKTKEFDELIINGDFLDLIKCPDFNSSSLDIINYLIESKKRVIYIIGNHDNPIKEFSDKSLVNIEFKTSYSFKYYDRNYFITHGDNYDSGLVRYPGIMKLVSIIQDFIERMAGINLSSILSKLIRKKERVKSFWSIVDSKIDSDVVIIGHLHRPEVLIWVDENSRVKTYANTGDWVENNTYIEISNGLLRLKKFKN